MTCHTHYYLETCVCSKYWVSIKIFRPVNNGLPLPTRPLNADCLVSELALVLLKLQQICVLSAIFEQTIHGIAILI